MAKKIYKVIDEARDVFYVCITAADPVDETADTAAAQAAYEAWRDVPNIENPTGRAVISVELFASDDANAIGRSFPNYLEA